MKILDYIFLLRPVLLAPAWTIFLLGYFHGSSGTGYSFRTISYSDHFFEISFFFTLLVGAIYVYNQIMDKDSDRINNKLFILSRELIASRSASIYAFLLTCGAALGAWYFMGTRMLVLFLLCAIIGGLYNFRPFLFKNRPIGGLIANISGHGYLTFIIGYLSSDAGASLCRMLQEATPYSLAVGSVYLCTTIPDLEGDRLANKKTFAVQFGKKATQIISALFVAVALLFALFMDKNSYIVVAALLALCAHAAMYFDTTGRSVHFAIKIPVLILSVLCVYTFPWYAGLIALVFVSARFYYKKRFGILFPNFNLK